MHGGAGIGVASGDLYVAQADARVEHGGDEGVTQRSMWSCIRDIRIRSPQPGA